MKRVDLLSRQHVFVNLLPQSKGDSHENSSSDHGRVTPDEMVLLTLYIVLYIAIEK